MSEQCALDPVDILLVEDCPEQVRHVRHALMLGKFNNRLHTVGANIEAMAYLRRQSPYQDVPEPSLVLLDLGLPNQSAIDMLAEMKTNADFRHIPVIGLIDRMVVQDLTEHLSASVDYCISKPVELPQFIDAIRSIKIFSLMIVHATQQE